MTIAKHAMVEDPTLTKASETAAAKRPRTKTEDAEFPWARCGTLALGIWLQISAFVWPHADDSRMSAWLPGLLISVVSLLAMSAPPMRWLNSLLALLLIAWTFSSAGTEVLTYWNGVAVGLLVLILSTIRSRSVATDWVDG